MTFRFVLQNKNALLLTVLEIERTIYIWPGQGSEVGNLLAEYRSFDQVGGSLAY